MILRHIHLPGITDYTYAAKLQDHLVSTLLAHKAKPGSTPAPHPTVITAQFHPVYTCGRREVNSVAPEQIEYLTRPTSLGQAAFHTALRGGQTTFHGPGQLVAYPVIDLRRHSLTPRSYVCALEKSIIALCAQEFNLKTMTTDNPGVWVDDMHKLCALGVHLRRHVGSHGIGMNLSTELGWFERIVGCGLEGKFTTSLLKEGVSEDLLNVETVGTKFVKHFATRVEGVEDVVKVEEQDLN